MCLNGSMIMWSFWDSSGWRDSGNSGIDETVTVFRRVQALEYLLSVLLV